MKYKHGAPPLGTRYFGREYGQGSVKVLPSGYKLFFGEYEEVPPDEEEDYGSVLRDPKPKRPRGL